MKGFGDKTAQAASSGSRRDKSGRRKARRGPGLTLQMDRLLPIAEMDENGPWPPTSARPAHLLAQQTGDGKVHRAGPSPSGTHNTAVLQVRDEAGTSSASSKRRSGNQVWIEPGLAPVVYLALVAWVSLCLYLIMLHGAALSDMSSHFVWAWVMACVVSLTHEMLVQQVTAVTLKLLVNRSKKSGSVAARTERDQLSRPSQAPSTGTPTPGIVPYRAQMRTPGAAPR